MNDQRAKADAGKSDPLLLEADMPHALAIINRVLDYGLIKYERKSWLQVAKERWDAACGRHRRARYMGENFDQESGLLHMAHEAAGLVIQIELFVKANPQYDYLTFKQPPTAHKEPGASTMQARIDDALNGDKIVTPEANYRRVQRREFGTAR